jgi:predicted permease
METLLQDLRYAARSLRKSPGFTAVVVLTLGLGVGADTTMYSIGRGLLWQQPPVSDPGRLVVISAYSRTTGQYFDWSYADLEDFRATPAVFADVIAYYPTALSLGLAGRTDRVWGEMVSPNYFEALGVHATLGRTFTAAELTAPDAPPVAVLSEAAWRSRFNANPRVIGQPFRLNGHDYVIAGVAPARFSGLYYVGFQPELWVPATLYDQLVPSAPGQLLRRGATAFRLAGHLRQGIEVRQAQAAAAVIGARLVHDYASIYQGTEPFVQSLADSRPEPGNNATARLLLDLFLGGVGLVLLIACANVANLLLARATGRRRELAIRVAIGASRSRLVGQLLVEAALLAVAGGTVGVLVSVWATGLLSGVLRLPTDIPFAWEFRLDARVLLYALTVTVATALVFGLVPALHAVSPAVAKGLKTDAPVGRGMHRGTVRGALVVGQVAVSCLLLVAAGLAMRTLRAVRHVEPGFDVRNALTGSVAPTLLGYDTARSQRFYRRLVEGAAALPGVRGATVARYLPLDFSASGGGLFVAGRETTNRGGEPTFWSIVGPDYFATVGTPLVAGRDFAVGDSSGAPRVAIVSETAAGSFWPGADALGKVVRLNAPDSPAVRIVGIAHDVKIRQLTERPQPYLYLPLAQNPAPDVSVLVRTAGDPRHVEAALRNLVAGLDPDVPLAGVRTLEELVAGRALLLPRLSAQFAGVFAALAVLLAVIGLYGVMSYSVNQRAREIGIRMALGARGTTVVAMVLRGGMRLAAAGLALGVVLALAATRLLAGVLYGVKPADPTTYAAVALLLAAVAAAACLFPARRAAGVDPLIALRSE